MGGRGEWRAGLREGGIPANSWGRKSEPCGWLLEELSRQTEQQIQQPKIRVLWVQACSGKETYQGVRENVLEDKERQPLASEFHICSSSNGSYLRAVSRRVTGFIYSFKDHSGCWLENRLEGGRSGLQESIDPPDQ